MVAEEAAEVEVAVGVAVVIEQIPFIVKIFVIKKSRCFSGIFFMPGFS